ncbi:MAG: PHP domain-containing protein [Bacteroidales bacterium]|jgi:PHP family Zn ribbon phosphoesterase|nr:PHP domain-containing protein [Bacteroidales bacterium]
MMEEKMNLFKADLHIHTLLSPCGDLDMTPENIVRIALQRGLDIIGITDHNSTRHCKLAEKYAKNRNIFVLCGAEVTTKEEAHVLSFFPDHESLDLFQQFLEEHLPNIPNDPDFFGDQVQIDEEMNIIYEEPRLLTSAIDCNIEQVSQKVHQLGGIIIPAHIDKSRNSIISQLGFIPFDLQYEAVELSIHGDKQKILEAHPYLKERTFLCDSDAHIPDLIGKVANNFHIPHRSFDEIKKALAGIEGRFVGD